MVKIRKGAIEEIERLVRVKAIIENIREVAKSAPLEVTIKLIQMHKAAIYLKKNRIRKLFPKHLRGKIKDYEKRVELILIQLNKYDHDTLPIICDDFLNKVTQDVPELLMGS